MIAQPWAASEVRAGAMAGCCIRTKSEQWGHASRRRQVLIQAVKIAFVCLHSHFQLQDKCQGPGVGRGDLVEAGLPDQLQVHHLLLKI